MSLTKKTYLQGFLVAVLILACLRWAFPEIAAPMSPSEPETAADSLQTAALADAKPAEKPAAKPAEKTAAKPAAKGKKYHRILSVPSYTATFPDTNAVQLVAAQKWGVTPVKNREDAESRKRELVYIGSIPLSMSIRSIRASHTSCREPPSCCRTSARRSSTVST